MDIKATTVAHLKLKRLPKSDELLDAFVKLRSMVLQYKPSLRIVKDTDTNFEAWNTREISVRGKKLRHGVMFASLVRLKEYVGLYFQPLYFDPGLADHDVHDLISIKTGLTCFHYKMLDDVLALQTKILLDKGWHYYRSKQWV